MREVGFRCSANEEEPVVGIPKFVDLDLSFSPSGINSGYTASADCIVFSRLGLYGGGRCGIWRRGRVDWVFVAIVH